MTNRMHRGSRVDEMKDPRTGPVEIVPSRMGLGAGLIATIVASGIVAGGLIGLFAYAVLVAS